MNNMNRIFRITLTFFIMLIFIWWGNRVFAFELLNGKLDLYGYLEHFTATQFSERHNDSGNLANFRNSFQLEGVYKMIDNEDLKVNLFFMTRLFYEGAFDLDGSYGDALSNKGEHFLRRGRKRDRIRELYVDINYKRWNIRLGKQIVTWGEADGFRMADVINPLDMSWHFTFEGWEDISLPLWMVRVIYNIPHPWDPKIEVIYIPTDFQHNRYAPYGANWSPGFTDAIWSNIRHGAPHGDLNDGEFGIRLSATIKGVDLSIQDFYSRVDDPLFTDNPSSFERGMLYNDLGLFEFPRVNILGGKFAFYNRFTRAIIRGEWGYNFGQDFNAAGGTPYKIKERDIFAYMIGFDRPTMIPFLSKWNHSRSYFISCQMFQKYIMNHNHDLMTGMGTDKSQTTFTLLVNTGFFGDTVNPGCLIAYCTSGYGFALPNVAFKYGPDLNESDHWRFIIGGDFLWGSTKKEGTGSIRDHDQIYVKLRYEFF